MGIEFTDSAAKHGISEQDALYVMSRPVYTSTKVKLNDGNPASPRRVFIGPQHPQTDPLIEVLIDMPRLGTFVIYHAMPLGSHYRQQMEEEQ